jgi:hypothetical protein
VVENAHLVFGLETCCCYYCCYAKASDFLFQPPGVDKRDEPGQCHQILPRGLDVRTRLQPSDRHSTPPHHQSWEKLYFCLGFLQLGSTTLFQLPSPAEAVGFMLFFFASCFVSSFFIPRSDTFTSFCITRSTSSMFYQCFQNDVTGRPTHSYNA